MDKQNYGELAYARSEIAKAAYEIIAPLERGTGKNNTAFICVAFLFELLEKLEEHTTERRKMANNRKPIQKSIRMEVFKRDSFTCQYCGRSAPNVILEIDHITPVSKGGDNSIMNLVTSCRDCNRGKGARELDDDSIVMIQKKQIDDINERRQQMEMMIEWRESLVSMMDEQIDSIERLYKKLYGNWAYLNDAKRVRYRKLINEFGYENVYEATQIACLQYREMDEAAEKVGGICYNRKIGVGAWGQEL